MSTLAALAAIATFVIGVFVAIGKTYQKKPWFGGRLQGIIIAAIVLSVVQYAFPVAAINTILEARNPKGNILPNPRGMSYREGRDKFIEAGFKKIQPFPADSQYLNEPNTIIVEITPEPGKFYPSDTTIEVVVEVKKPLVKTYKLQYPPLPVVDAKRNELTKIELEQIDIRPTTNEFGEQITNLRTYLRITNRLDQPVILPPLNNNGIIAYGVVLKDNNSVPYGVHDFDVLEPKNAKWGISKQLKINGNKSVYIYIEFKDIKTGAGEFELSLDFGTRLTTFGKFTRIRLSDAVQ